ncbi:Membrane bound O-acyl transferase, MBOAT domain-containing protein [Rozella allomycis CSF55]|uniref:Membrane bound O-acyl transferase, MBOAT domain-containing protein n=1 Tax=Rozella allomycis (strain CSF55) TaxID=988480 RepID=A0A075B2F0_ROZAC|nr:Membrane bound O-acyl transferase, MBOAT domain-containing protein [Rozella allomycis CSF55]|eukprot:EPZ34993.1 Membrane bound O-acyl transferase, MBOAT domain-containing protein [Rozella allomycis CSF55]
MSDSNTSYYYKYKGRLSTGWLFNRPVDNSDKQYAGFRNNLMALTLLFTLFSLSSVMFKNTKRNTFYLFVSGIFLFILHEFGAAMILLLVSINYIIAKKFNRTKFNPALTWILNILYLCLMEYAENILVPRFSVGLPLVGSVRRWPVYFKVTLLRMISFNIDYYKSFSIMKDESKECNFAELTLQVNLSSERGRSEKWHSNEEYSFKNYLIYLFYPPLYLAGPIVTFNNFQYQINLPKPITNAKDTMIYGVRWIISWFCMECLMHSFHVVAIKDAKAWTTLNAYELASVGFWNLISIWLKLLIIWRFHRFWALVDGIEAPENMMRCMCNNYSAQGFWRSWHRSFNQWIIRYLYIPLGGSRTALYNIWIVFTFVALWHDFSVRMIAWGWLISLFILPEIVAGWVDKRFRLERLKYYRNLCAVGGAVNVFTMMSGNLVGFALGLDGMKYLIEQISKTNGI